MFCPCKRPLGFGLNCDPDCFHHGILRSPSLSAAASTDRILRERPPKSLHYAVQYFSMKFNHCSGATKETSYDGLTGAKPWHFHEIQRASVLHCDCVQILDGTGSSPFGPMTTEPRIVYEFGPFRMDPIKQTLLRDNNPIPLTPKAFETLLVLVRHSRDVISKEELLKEVWPDSFVEESNLSQNIFLLRKALGDTAKDRQYIVTLPGRGYRFSALVRSLTEPGKFIVAHARTHTHILIEEKQG